MVQAPLFSTQGYSLFPRENPNVDVTTRFFWRSIWRPEEDDKKKAGEVRPTGRRLTGRSVPTSSLEGLPVLSVEPVELPHGLVL